MDMTSTLLTELPVSQHDAFNIKKEVRSIETTNMQQSSLGDCIENHAGEDHNDEQYQDCLRKYISLHIPTWFTAEL